MLAAGRCSQPKSFPDFWEKITVLLYPLRGRWGRGRSRLGNSAWGALGFSGLFCSIPQSETSPVSIRENPSEHSLGLPPGPQVSKGKRDSTAPHICSVAQRAYRTLLAQRRDQAIVPMGRSGAGKTTSCQLALEHLVGTVGSVDGRVSGRVWVSDAAQGLR